MCLYAGVRMLSSCPANVDRFPTQDSETNPSADTVLREAEGSSRVRKAEVSCLAPQSIECFPRLAVCTYVPRRRHGPQHVNTDGQPQVLQLQSRAQGDELRSDTLQLLLYPFQPIREITGVQSQDSRDPVLRQW